VLVKTTAIGRNQHQLEQLLIVILIHDGCF